MKDEELLCFAAEYIYHGDERIRRQAEKAWDIIMKKSRRIENGALNQELAVPKGAKSSQQMLDEMFVRMRTDKG